MLLKERRKKRKCFSTSLYNVIVRFMWMFVYVTSVHIYEDCSTSFVKFFYVPFVVYLSGLRHFYDTYGLRT